MKKRIGTYDQFSFYRRGFSYCGVVPDSYSLVHVVNVSPSRLEMLTLHSLPVVNCHFPIVVGVASSNCDKTKRPLFMVQFMKCCAKSIVTIVGGLLCGVATGELIKMLVEVCL